MLKYFQSNKIALWILMLAGIMTAHSQQSFVIRTNEADAGENEPVPSATICIAGSMRGIRTNAEGDFRCTFHNSTVTLVASYVGHTSETVVITGGISRRLLIRMQPNTIQVAEMAVTGEDPRFKSFDILWKAKRNG